MKSQFKKPDRYAKSSSPRLQKKWDIIINAFIEVRFNELKKIHRTGTRGRIFAVLINDMLKILKTQNESEPIFDHITPNKWYQDFVSKHDDIKIRTHKFYNPDYILQDGTWLEITLSENTAYKKLFRYGHQAPLLKVLWIDEDIGLHKKICESVEFPNAKVINIQKYFSKLEKLPGGYELINQFGALKKIKGIIK